jgi:hypothetical protein
VLPYYAGDEVGARELAANDFKYWELMRRSCERGLKVFDYGRSKQGTGFLSFKKNWGFEPQPLFYEYCLYGRDSIPQNNPSNAKYRLLIDAWRRLPIGLANWLGPLHCPPPRLSVLDGHSCLRRSSGTDRLLTAPPCLWKASS